MSWISDVQRELNSLDFSKKSLRTFGLGVGAVFLLIALWMAVKSYAPLFPTVLAIVGVFLVIGGLIIPQSLRKVYSIWMGMAFAIGWVVSRVLLTGIFFLVLTPIGFVARLFGKEFMDVKFAESGDTLWVRREKGKKINYEKMH
jgi:hypothetical protein